MRTICFTIALTCLLCPLASLAGDGTFQWHPRISGVSETLRGITRGADRFVAVGDAGVALVSPDGASWEAGDSKTGQTLAAVAYGNGTFVAVSESSVFTSADGLVWEEQSTPLHEPMHAIAFGNELFYAVGGYSILPRNDILKSRNGIDWEVGGTRSTRGLRAVAFGEGSFVMAGIDGSGHCSAGDTFLFSNPFISYIPDIHAVLYTGGYFFYAGDEGRIYRMHNFNGSCTLQFDEEQSWGSTNAIRALAAGSDWLVAAGDQGLISVSAKGIGWTVCNPPTENHLRAAAFADGRFLVLGDQGTILQSGFVSPLEISRPSHSPDGRFSIFVNAEPGRSVGLEGSPRVHNPQWKPLTNAIGIGPDTILTDPEPNTGENRFYRVVGQ